MSRVVAVRRTGGFAGLARTGEVDLDGDDDRVAELGELVQRIDPGSLPAGDPHPDGFVYAFDLCGEAVTVPEQHLTDDLRRVAELVL